MNAVMWLVLLSLILKFSSMHLAKCLFWALIFKFTETFLKKTCFCFSLVLTFQLSSLFLSCKHWFMFNQISCSVWAYLVIFGIMLLFNELESIGSINRYYNLCLSWLRMIGVDECDNHNYWKICRGSNIKTTRMGAEKFLKESSLNFVKGEVVVKVL